VENVDKNVNVVRMAKNAINHVQKTVAEKNN
jgi:hypothetical protein